MPSSKLQNIIWSNAATIRSTAAISAAVTRCSAVQPRVHSATSKRMMFCSAASRSAARLQQNSHYTPTSITPLRTTQSVRCLSATPATGGTTDTTIVGEAEGEMVGLPRPVYLDNQATTAVDPRVLDKMLPSMIHAYGNPHSRTHSFGWEAEDAVEQARKHVASLIGATPREIIFTSGATESNNMALKGAANFYGAQYPKRRHIITSQIDHKCVLASARALQGQGWDVTYLPVKSDGLICLDEFEKSIRPGETLLASIMWVNNEIGVVQPINEIARICKKHKVLFHTDGAQGVGKLPLDVDSVGVDLVSISGHKLYGPKGVGALYIRSKPRVRLAAVISGGGQERGFRSGTLPAPIIVGLGEACKIASEEMENDRIHITRLADRMYNGINDRLPEVTLNGSKLHRYHGSLNLSFAYVEGESLLMSLPQVAVSSGSACTSASLEPSYVLRAIGVNEELAHTSIRFGIGRFTTEEEIDGCVEQVVEHVERLREMSPLWEMAQAGDTTEFVWT
eukprot:Lankesteria_metandrocarpae@DN2754_c0_g1_i1.p1